MVTRMAECVLKRSTFDVNKVAQELGRTASSVTARIHKVELMELLYKACDMYVHCYGMSAFALVKY